MPIQVVPLTDARCRRAAFKLGGKNKLPDGGGLYLELKPNGSKTWRMRYVRPSTGKESTLTFGNYPAVSLAAAREKRAEAERKIAAGQDPDLKAAAPPPPPPPATTACRRTPSR
ncbi:Arm DNA-binding domain-containing protein [Bordetella hinzii]|uniref:Arm DNA-binding domain-containing protein n=3 Tax=Bordetella hinzii TaxID=103855 RepID=UPI000F6D8202|nr:phage-related integrase [Bordetella hinzii]